MKKRTPQILGATIFVCVATFALIIGQGVRSQNTADKNSHATTAGQEDATPVQEGVKTERQREHGKIFSERYAYRKEQKLRDIGWHKDIQVKIGVGDRPTDPSAPPFNLEEFIRNMTCDSDAILVGQVKNKVSQLTENEEFTFTDYDITVEEVIKNNATSPINVQSNITVTRPGGTIQLGGRIIRGIDASYKPFALGSRVLLFLKFIPTTGAYKAFRSEGSFVLSGDKLVKLTEEDLPAELENEKDAEVFSAKIRSYAVQTCNR